MENSKKIQSNSWMDKIKEINKYNKTKNHEALTIDLKNKPSGTLSLPKSQDSDENITNKNEIWSIKETQQELENASITQQKPKFIRGQRNNAVCGTTQVKGKLNIHSLLHSNQKPVANPNPLFMSLPPNTDLSLAPQNIANPQLSKSLKPTPIEGEIKKEVINTSNSFFYNSQNCSKSILEYAYREDINRRYKDEMEDKSKAIDFFNNTPNESLFCIFDGHGGEDVANYLRMNYPKVYKTELLWNKNNKEAAWKNSFRKIDLDIAKHHFVSMGSTGCVVHIIRESESSLIVHWANVGDTRCTLINPSNYQRLSFDHRATDPDEKIRIKNSGGTVIQGRVMGQWMLSRAFGDHELKNFGVKADPYITHTEIDLEIKNQFLIIACDGIWDVWDEWEIQQKIMFNNKTEDLCKSIVKAALDKNAWDNLSIFVVKLT